MNTYVIALTNGNTYEVVAKEVEWDTNAKSIRFIADRMIVARFNNDNIAGWMNKGYVITDTEGKE